MKRLILRVYLESVDAKYGGMVLQIMGSNYHAHSKYCGIINGVVFGIKRIMQDSSFKYVFDFAMEPLLFK